MCTTFEVTKMNRVKFHKPPMNFWLCSNSSDRWNLFMSYLFMLWNIFSLKSNKMSAQKLPALTKQKIDKHILTIDHHTVACFLVFTVIVQSVLINLFITPQPFFCYSMYYVVFICWLYTAYLYIIPALMKISHCIFIYNIYF